jgi:hypothetical protein
MPKGAVRLEEYREHNSVSVGRRGPSKAIDVNESPRPNNETSGVGDSGMSTSVEADPIFSRIEVVRQAFAWQDQLFNSLHSNVHFLDRRGCDTTIPFAWAETIKNSDRVVNQAIEELLTTAPTTLQGVAAILDYVGSADPDMDDTRLFEFADSNVRNAAMRFPKFLAETIRQLIAKSSNRIEEASDSTALASRKLPSHLDYRRDNNVLNNDNLRIGDIRRRR